MDQEIANVEISKEFDIDVKLVNGKLKLIAGYEGKGMGSEFSVYVDGDYFLDKLADAIPGEWDRPVIEIIKLAMKV